MATTSESHPDFLLRGPGKDDVISYAYVCKLERAVIQDARKASSGLQFLTGSAPVWMTRVAM
jgi:hypothetical protein